MADWTELVLRARLRTMDARALDALEWMATPHPKAAGPPADDGAKLWTLQSAASMLHGGSLVVTGSAPWFARGLATDSPEDGELAELRVACAFVDREGQSDAFLAWLGPLVDSDIHARKPFLGWRLWQGGDGMPLVLLYDAATRSIRLRPLARP